MRLGRKGSQEPDRLPTMVRVSERAVATSGSYLQYFESSGRRYHHLIDPATAAPRVCGTRSLAASDCVTADAAATALFDCDPRAAAGVLAAHAPGAGVVLATWSGSEVVHARRSARRCVAGLAGGLSPPARRGQPVGR